MRYLVTGGAGFIGSHLVQALVARQAQARVFDSLEFAQAQNLATITALRDRGAVEVMVGDIRDLAAVRQAMDGVDVVFHEAALASAPATVADPVGSLAINVVGMQNVLVAARDAGVRRLVFASSAAIYGSDPTLPKQETMAPQPLSPYAVHKLTGEYLCAVASSLYGLETVALRYFNVFGPRQDPASAYAAVIPRFVTALQAGERPVVYGDGEQTRDFVYIENVVQANLLAAVAPAAVGAVINIGSGERLSLNELLRTISVALGTTCDADYQAARPGDVRDSVADTQRARTLLGYAPTVDTREGLARTVAALIASGGAPLGASPRPKVQPV